MIRIAEQVNRSQDNLHSKLEYLKANIQSTRQQVTECKDRIALVEETQLALKEVLPLLTQSSISECEELANKAVSQVFGLDYRIEWDSEGGRFLINNGEYLTDLVDGNGGGISTLISFVFNVFLITKTNSRRFMCYDEAFTQVSAQYFPQFISFVRDLCTTLHVDLLLISHDQRITADDVDRVYRVEDNTIKRLK